VDGHTAACVYSSLLVLVICVHCVIIRVGEAPSLAHGGGEGLGEGDHEGGNLGGLLGHHVDLVRVCGPGQGLDHGSHHRLNGIVGLLVGAAGTPGDGKEQLEADQGHVPPGEGVLTVEINSIDSVGLTGPGLPGDEVDKGGGELEGELDHGGDEAAILLGLGAQLGCRLTVDAVADVIGGASELATELGLGVFLLWETVTLDKAGTEDQASVHSRE